MHAHAWLLALISLCARPESPRDRFDEIADAIESAAGDDLDLAAELVALAARESRFDPMAIGHDGYGESYGLFQIHESNLTSAAPAFDPVSAAWIAADMVTKSHRICRARPRSERLGWYASGGNGCGVEAGLRASRNRTALADWLVRERPYFVVSSGEDVRPKRDTRVSLTSR